MVHPEKIFLDRDKDGIIDTIDLQLHLNPSCGRSHILSAVMDLASCLGFETMGLNLPLVKGGEGGDPSFHHHLYIGLNRELKEIDSKEKERVFLLGEEDEASLIKSIKEFTFSLISRKAAFRKGSSIIKDKKKIGFNLLNPFSTQGFYGKSFKDPLHVFLSYKILLFSYLNCKTAAEAANFAARLGLESISLSLPLTFPFEEKPRKEESFIYIGKKEELDKIGLQRLGDGFGSNWESGIFLLPSKKKIPDVLICGDETGLEKILKNLSYLPMNSKGANEPIFDSIRSYFEKVSKFISGTGFPEKNSFTQKVVKEYIIPDEKKEIIKLLKEGLQNWEGKSKSVDIQIFLMRPEKNRKEFRDEIQKWIKSYRMPKEKMKITVLNAYKPGLSWMREVVLKEISMMQIDRTEIAFKEFKMNGLEESTRWLQEIYPFDEILAKQLGISKKKVEFKKDSRIKEVYRVRAWREGRLVYENQFSPRWTRQSYLFSFPRLGKVHPDTGWVMMSLDGEKVINQRIKTGMEQIWDVYQKEIIPLVEREVDKALSKLKSLPHFPLFKELRFDIYFNYPMESLGIDEERISPLEALHEDLYFVTLNFFSNWLKRKRLKGISPGRVLPVIHPNFQGRDGRVKITLVRQPEETFLKNQGTGKFKAFLNGIVFNPSEVGIDFFVDPGKKEKYRCLKERLRSLGPSKDGVFKNLKYFEDKKFGRKRFRLIAFESDFAKRKKSQSDSRGIPIRVPMERPIGYREGVRLIKSLKGLPGIDVMEERISSGGLPIFSIENTYPCPSHFVSHAKRMVLRPTFFVNCRHHANEISSTNAGLKLSHLLATQPHFHSFLKKTNVVVNPMENVDGMVILDEMLRLTPTDKLHAARYNQAGQEYYTEYFNPQTSFSEARVKPLIWEKWLPDICVDNHGFPSHEWDQPFSGNAPFHFREWWIPRAFFFIYLPFLKEKEAPSQRINAEALGKWITQNLSKERAVMRWNRSFSERYWKYRGQWLQNRIHRSRDPIPYLPIQKRFRQTNYAYRYPYITTIDFITEVADETVQGKFLKACIQAHLRTNLAIIKLLNCLDFPVKKRCLIGKREIHFLWSRERPLVFKKS